MTATLTLALALASASLASICEAQAVPQPSERRPRLLLIPSTADRPGDPATYPVGCDRFGSGGFFRGPKDAGRPADARLGNVAGVPDHPSPATRGPFLRIIPRSGFF